MIIMDGDYFKSSSQVFFFFFGETNTSLGVPFVKWLQGEGKARGKEF